MWKVHVSNRTSSRSPVRPQGAKRLPVGPAPRLPLPADPAAPPPGAPASPAAVLLTDGAGNPPERVTQPGPGPGRPGPEVLTRPEPGQTASDSETGPGPTGKAVPTKYPDRVHCRSGSALHTRSV